MEREYLSITITSFLNDRKNKMVNETRSIRCVILRGGTSKGVYLLENDLPQNSTLRDKVVLAIFGSPDKRQIDGLGGADPLTSKVAIVGPSDKSGIDIEYLFGQVSIDEAKVYYHSMCGNITSGVGPFAINSGLVKANEGITVVRMFNRNTGKKVVAEVPVVNGKASCNGEYSISGVPGTSAKINVDFGGTSGALTGKLLPTGKPLDRINVPEFGEIDVSIVDCGACQIFVRARDLGLTGIEMPKEIDSQTELLRKLESIRAYATYIIGLSETPTSASITRRNTPHISIVSPAQNYSSYLTGDNILATSIDLTARMMFMQIMHKTYAGTGSVCLSVASQIPGSIVNEVANKECIDRGVVRFGHPAGIIEIEVKVVNKDGEFIVERAAIGRTARLIMEGHVYVRESVFSAE